MIGTVKFFDQSKGFGFLTREDGANDVFVHLSGLARDVSVVLAGEAVEFRIGSRDGRPIALDVRPVRSTIENIRAMETLRKKVDHDLTGIPGANEALGDLRFTLIDLEKIAARLP